VRVAETIAGTLLLAAMFAACGQKGPLVLPEPPQPQAATSGPAPTGSQGDELAEPEDDADDER
jgi:predicted small lipoprotein YifL